MEQEKISFKDLVNLDEWDNYHSFMEKNDIIIEKDVIESLKIKSELREQLLKDEDLKKRIKRVSEEDFKWAEQELFNTRVCAVDGTIAKCPLTSGARYRIGVVATSYKNDRIEKILYLSEKDLVKPYDSPINFLKKMLDMQRSTYLLSRSIMFYAERQLALKRDETWKFTHGSLLPIELFTPSGEFRTLEEGLELCKKIVEARNVIGVIEETTHIDLLHIGEILDSEKLEYMYIKCLKNFIDDYLKSGRYEESDMQLMRDFSNNYADNISIGMFKVGAKPYLFHAHKDNFDKAAALIMRDAKNQTIRGFPLLIDYADNVCSTLLSANDFERQILFKVAKLSGGESVGFEIKPRATRRK